MKKQHRHYILSFLFVPVVMGMLVPLLSSCGKGASTNPSFNTQLNVINLSPDVLPVYLYVNYVKQNRVSYKYSIPSGYVSIATLDTPLQIRNLQFTTVLSRGMAALSSNTKYTWIITGLASKSSLTSIFTTDTSAAPQSGYSKVRFIHSSPNTNNLDVYANGTLAFPNITYKTVSSFVSLPAGNYDVKIYSAGTTNLLSDLKTTTFQDGRLYTVYTQGVFGRVDSAAFGAAVITNR